MSKVLKIFYRFQYFKCYVCQDVKDGFCSFYTTLHPEYMHLTHVEGVEDVKYYCTLYKVASCPCQEGRLFEPSILKV